MYGVPVTPMQNYSQHFDILALYFATAFLIVCRTDTKSRKLEPVCGVTQLSEPKIPTKQTFASTSCILYLFSLHLLRTPSLTILLATEISVKIFRYIICKVRSSTNNENIVYRMPLLCLDGLFNLCCTQDLSPVKLASLPQCRSTSSSPWTCANCDAMQSIITQ